MQIAVDALGSDRGVVQGRVAVLDRRPVPRQLRYRRGGGGQPLPHGVHRNATLRRPQRRGERSMHRRHRLPEPVRFAGEIPAHLVGVQVALGVQVPGAGRRHIPAVRGVRGVLGQHAQRPGLVVDVDLQGAQQPGNMGIVGPAQHPAEFDIGVDPGSHPTEQFEDRALGEHHAGVALLGGDHPRLGIGGQHRCGLSIDQRQQQLCRIRLIESVIPGSPARRADGRHCGVVGRRRRIPLHHNLIPLRIPVGVPSVDQHHLDVIANRQHQRHPHGLEVPVASGIPPLSG